MTPLVSNVTYLMGIGTLVLHFALVIFILVTILSLRWREWLHERLGTHGVTISLAIIAASLVGSLFYSEVAGFAACFLCWIVRFLIYPQLLLLGGYLYKKHHWFLTASFAMSVGAAFVSLYQIYLQAGGSKFINCDVIQSLGSCETEYFRIFGYVNIAVMSLTAAVALVACQAVILHRKHWLPHQARRSGA